jgi:hypothetical protein
MPTTQRVSSPAVNHRTVDAVAIRRMSRECVALHLGARKQRAAPKDDRVHQLRRDVDRDRRKPFETILRIAIADLQEGESLDDVLAPLWTAMHFLEEFAGERSAQELEAYIKIETALRSKESELEVDLLMGDKSSKTLRGLDVAFEQHERLLEEERTALHEELYGNKIAVA